MVYNNPNSGVVIAYTTYFNVIDVQRRRDGGTILTLESRDKRNCYAFASLSPSEVRDLKRKDGLKKMADASVVLGVVTRRGRKESIETVF